jgi:hypothetical protein
MPTIWQRIQKIDYMDVRVVFECLQWFYVIGHLHAVVCSTKPLGALRCTHTSLIRYGNLWQLQKSEISPTRSQQDLIFIAEAFTHFGDEQSHQQTCSILQTVGHALFA